jgi:hypothetical protein
MFVVRYDEGKQTKLSNHTDDAMISFNILLNDGFEGGGTRFWDRVWELPFAHIQPTQAGQVLLHTATLNHEGVHVSKGTRTILVGFLSVDRIEPWTNKPTGLTWFASWGSLPWSLVKFKEGHRASEVRISHLRTESWRNNPYVMSLFHDIVRVLTYAGDLILPHFESNLVADEDRDAFIAALDDAYERNLTQGGQASWFKGQQINVDIDGSVNSMWRTRETYEHRFMEKGNEEF